MELGLRLLLLGFLILLLPEPSVQRPYVLRLRIVMDGKAIQDFLFGRTPQERGAHAVRLLLDQMYETNRILAKESEIHLQITSLDMLHEGLPVTVNTMLEYQDHFKEFPPRPAAHDLFQVWTGALFPIPPVATFTYPHCVPSAVSIIPLINSTTGIRNDNPTITHYILWAIVSSLGLGTTPNLSGLDCECRDPRFRNNIATCVTEVGSGSLLMPKCAYGILQDKISRTCSGRTPDVRDSRYPVCGNGIKEFDEECDCFAKDEECRKCCSPLCKLFHWCATPPPTPPTTTTTSTTTTTTTTTPKPAEKPKPAVTPKSPTTTTTASPTPVPDVKSPTATTSPRKDEHQNMLIIYAAAGGGAVILIIVIVGVVACRRGSSARRRNPRAIGTRLKRGSSTSLPKIGGKASKSKSKPGFFSSKKRSIERQMTPEPDMGNTTSFFN